MSNSYAPEVQTDNTGKWYGNALRFTTEAEARQQVRDLHRRWLLVHSTRVVPSEDPPNYRWDDAGGLVTLDAAPLDVSKAEDESATTSSD